MNDAMTSQAVEVAIDTACRTLRLPTIRERAAHAADVAAREQHTYQGFLAELLLAECDDRLAGAIEPAGPSSGAASDSFEVEQTFLSASPRTCRATNR